MKSLDTKLRNHSSQKLILLKFGMHKSRRTYKRTSFGHVMSPLHSERVSGHYRLSYVQIYSVLNRQQSEIQSVFLNMFFAKHFFFTANQKTLSYIHNIEREYNMMI